jgi:hypothetical protein
MLSTRDLPGGPACEAAELRAALAEMHEAYARFREHAEAWPGDAASLAVHRRHKAERDRLCSEWTGARRRVCELVRRAAGDAMPAAVVLDGQCLTVSWREDDEEPAYALTIVPAGQVATLS